MAHVSQAEAPASSDHAGTKPLYTNKSCRLIIRNLPFKTTKEDLQKLCSSIGPFSEVAVPMCKDKRFPKSCAGFAFVNFVKKSDAAKAIEQLNFTQFMGRKIAIDWAVNKDEYVTSEINSKKEEKKEEESPEAEDSESEEKDEKEEEDEDDFLKADDDSESEGESASEGESSESEDEKCEETKAKAVKTPQKKRNDDSAVRDGRALFLRNLAFTTTNDQLREEFSQFGEVALAIICCFPGSDHSKGTAFIHFKTKEGADAAMEALNSDEGVLIDGRRVNAKVAVSRNDAVQFQNDAAGEKKVKDKRNLHLLRASFIRPGTDAANDMSQHDIEKRQKIAQQAKSKLKNLLMFVSPTRLIIYNVPKNMHDRTLRSTCLVATGNKDAQVTECKIWRDMEKLDARGLPESQGFAFVGFSTHEDAYACLKKMNNDPKIFTNDKRPIVDFCIENLSAVRAKERKLMKSKLPKGAEVKKLPAPAKPAVDESVEKTKAMLSKGGMKSLPKKFDVKRRHRDDKKKGGKAKKPASRKRKSTSESAKPAKSRKVNTKGVTKSLTMILISTMTDRTIYQFSVKDDKGEDVSLDKYKGKVCLIVNVASACGLTDANYRQLKELLDQYKSKGFEVLAFPCNQFGGQEPKCEIDIKNFVQDKFKFEPDLFQKIDVNGSKASPLYTFLKKEQGGLLIDAIKWNFTKFLVNREGQVVKRYGPTTEPKTFVGDIEALLDGRAL